MIRTLPQTRQRRQHRRFPMLEGRSMFNIWQSWFEAARFGCDVQNVIAMRSMRFLKGGPQASAEARRMVSEKVAAFAAAQAAAAYALATGKMPEEAAELAMAPV